MKATRLIMAALAACSLSIAACSTLPPITAPGTAPAQSVDNLLDRRVLAEAINAYNTTSSIYLDLVKAKALSPDVQAKAKAALQRTLSALRLAKALVGVVHSGAFDAQIAIATTSTREASSLLPRKD
jgi:hypothetical protein